VGKKREPAAAATGEAAHLAKRRLSTTAGGKYALVSLNEFRFIIGASS
jgi:hypothetical protein